MAASKQAPPPPSPAAAAAAIAGASSLSSRPSGPREALSPEAVHGVERAVLDAHEHDGVGGERMFSALVGLHCRALRVASALRVLAVMDARGVPVSPHTFSLLASACGKAGDAQAAKRVHDRVCAHEGQGEGEGVVRGRRSAKVGSTVPRLPNVAVATALVGMYCRLGDIPAALGVLRATHRPNHRTFTALLRGCAERGPTALGHGEEVHRHLCKELGAHGTGARSAGAPLLAPELVGALVHMYARCAGMGEALDQLGRVTRDHPGVDARHALSLLLTECATTGQREAGLALQATIERDRTLVLDTVLANSLVRMLGQCGLVQDAAARVEQMHRDRRPPPDHLTFVCALRGCVAPEHLAVGRRVHALLRLEHPSPPTPELCTALVSMYCKCGSLEDAVRVWREADAARPRSPPDAYTLSALLAGCAQERNAAVGREIHARLASANTALTPVLATSLLAVYSRCRCVNDAVGVLDAMDRRGILPTVPSLVALLGACADLGALEQGKSVHRRLAARLARRPRPCPDRHRQQQHEQQSVGDFDDGDGDKVATALITMYGKCGELGLALDQFELAVAANPSPPRSPPAASAAAAAAAAAGRGADAGKGSDGSEGGGGVGGGGGGGGGGVAVWNAALGALAAHARGADAVALLQRMVGQARVAPDAVTFANVLTACSHAGLADDAMRLLERMEAEFRVPPTTIHATCVVDALGRAGRLGDALEFCNHRFQRFGVSPDSVTWKTLLAASRTARDVAVAENAARGALALDPHDAAVHTLLCTAYFEAGLVVKAEEMRRSAKALLADDARAKGASPAVSAIEVAGVVHTFGPHDTAHPRISEIRQCLAALRGAMQARGHVANRSFVLEDTTGMDDDAVAERMETHSERLAIGLGLVATPDGTPLRVTKTLRICGDCHSAIKALAAVTNRHISVRDNVRWHHFHPSTGTCSCNEQY